MRLLSDKLKYSSLKTFSFALGDYHIHTDNTNKNHMQTGIKSGTYQEIIDIYFKFHES